jgi:hypothetical protein
LNPGLHGEKPELKYIKITAPSVDVDINKSFARNKNREEKSS